MYRMITRNVNINILQRPMRDMHLSHVLPSFWYTIELVPFDPSFWYQKNLVPECMTYKPSFWYEFVVPVLGRRRTWVVCHGPYARCNTYHHGKITVYTYYRRRRDTGTL